MIQRDREATAARRFENDKSEVLKDGRERLYGMDWTARKEQLWVRCRGRCEHIFVDFPRARCTNEAEDPHHQIKRSEMRDDRLSNLVALCRKHHNQMHEKRNPRLKWVGEFQETL